MKLLLISTLLSCAWADTYNSITVEDYELTYYYWGDDTVGFSEATHACVTMNGNLVKVDKKGIQDAIINLMSFWDYSETWIGGTDMYQEEYWRWIDGTLLWDGYEHWAYNQPDNYNNNEHCLIIVTPSEWWADQPCSSRKGFICQTQICSVSSFSHMVLVPGVTEVFFQEAKQTCADMGMRLVEVKNPGTFQAVQRKLGRENTSKYWIGGKVINQNGMWQWNEGSIMSFRKWAPGMPSDSQKNRCLTTSYVGWENDDCEESKHKYLCESIRPHSLRISSQNIIISEARDIKIECTADGFPLPDVAWYKDNQRITDKTDERIHQSAESAKSTLLINNARLDDAGTYRCYAINYANGTKGWTEGFSKLKVLPLGELIPEYDQIKGLEQEFDAGENNENDIENNPEENACADYGWVLPVLITMFVVLILQFVFILCQRRISAQTSTKLKTEIRGYTNNEVFYLEQEQKS